jgi:outer membrane protein assembly factor BamB
MLVIAGITGGIRKLGIGLLAVFAAANFSLSAARAGDWPQVLGPHRNGIAEGEELASRWKSGGPPVTWEREVGASYSGVAVAAGRGFVFHRLDSEEVIEAVDVATGNPIWKQAYPTTFAPSVGAGDGPLCVPTVAGRVVITYGAQGVLSACDTATGQVLWRRETHRDFGAREGYFGAGSAPLVAGNVVVVNVGGDKANSGIVGFNLKTGDTLWAETSEQGSYAAPVLTQANGNTMAIVVTRLNCVAINPATGGLYWRFPFGMRGPTVNGASPLILDDHLFLTASYGIGASYNSFTLAGFNNEWKNDTSLSSQYTTPIEHEGFLYGIHGRDDIPPADLVCVDAAEGKVRWSEPSFGYATLLKADGRIIAVKTDGTLALFEPNPESFRPLSQARVFKRTVRALPALSNGGLFVRDETTLKRFDVSPQ